MADENVTGEGDEAEVKRRSTYSPPPENVAFPDRLGELTDEDIQRAKQASEAAAQASPRQADSEPTAHQATYSTAPVDPPAPVEPPAPTAPRVPPAPIRTSLADEEIMAQFRDGHLASTEAMMSALESQLDMRAQEEQRFAAWEADVRNALPADEADHLVRTSRRAFDGLPPLTEPEPAPSPVVSHEPTETPEPAAEAGGNPLLASMVVDTGDIMATTGEPIRSATTDFEAVLADPEATSPPTSSWPLVAEESGDSDGADGEGDPEENTEPLDDVPGDEGTEEVAEEGGASEVPAPSLVSSGVSVGTETVSIREAVATREIPEEPFVAITAEKERWFSFDRVGIEPAPDINRTAGSLQLFWTWWATSVPLGGIVIGAWLMQGGASLVQAVIAAAAGVVVGALPLIVGTLVGIRSGLPALIASRAAFGLAGNILPAILLLVVRVVVSAFFVWAAVWVASGVYVEANLWRLDRIVLEVLLATGAVIIVGVLVIAGRRFVSLMLWTSAGLSLVAAGVLIFLTWDIPTRASFAMSGGRIESVVAGASLVAAVLMMMWAQSASDVARFAKPGKKAAATSMVALAAVIPPLVFITWGALLGASGSTVRNGLLEDPLGVLLSLAPGWYPIPALVLLALPLLGVAALALHSSSYALMSVGINLSRYTSAAVVTVVTAGALFAVLIVVGDPTGYFVDGIRVVGIVVAAWVGVVIGETLTRRVPLSPSLLLGTTGDFPVIRIAPLLGFLGAIGLGWGFTTATTPWLTWLGYLLDPLVQLGLIDLGRWQLGLGVALVVAFSVAALAGVRGGIVTTRKKKAT
jgi:NCS1 family nucleobase:cation symporter-1